MGYSILEWKASDPEQFVAFWACRYSDPNEPLYSSNIDGPLTAESVRSLFIWKNGGKLSRKKRHSVQENYISRLEELSELPDDLQAEEFLQRWPRGGAIWRIFWLHCWKPDRFPIFDQHVYRAAAAICGWDECEIPGSDRERVTTYFTRFIPFWNDLGLNTRDADRALWAFGRFIKSYPGPSLSSHR
jgi:hypothetical protein